MSKIDSSHTIYSSGHTMLTPLDPLVKREAQKLHQFEQDHLQMVLDHAKPVDPLLEGPYAEVGEPVAKKPAPRPTPQPRPAPRPVTPQAAPKQPPADAPPAGISRPLYTGGAPTLRPDQMDEAVINSSPILKFFYSLPEASKLRMTFLGASRVLGPLGAIVNVGYNLFNLKRIWQDPNAPAALKGGVVASTALAGASAYAAGRLALSSFGYIAPMTTAALKTWGKFAGAAGMGAGAILSAMDTYNTFRDPKATPAEKTFSSLATIASVVATASVIFPPLAPFGLVAGLATVGFSLLKGWLGHNKTVNNALGAVGHFFSHFRLWGATSRA